MKGLAAVLVRQNAPLALEDIEIPPVGVGQVLVRVLCTGICGSQIGEIAGAKGPDKFLPHLLGHEGSGEVLECGPGVRTVKPGDRVVLHWRKGAGLEGLTPTYESRIGRINAGWVTTFNEYAVVSENRVTAVPPETDPEVASLLGCAVTTGFGAVINNARVRIGESVAVFGAGGIGLSIVQGASLAGAHPILAVDRFANRLELAAKLGATHTILAGQVDAEAEVKRLVGEVDVAFDNTGNPSVIEAAYRVTNARGRTILVGVPPTGKNASIYTLPLHFEKVLTGSHGGEARPEFDIPNYLRLAAAGKVELGACLGTRYPLTDINRALDDMTNGTLAGRAVVWCAPRGA